MEGLLERIEQIIAKRAIKTEGLEGNGTIFDEKCVAEELTELISGYELKPSDWSRFVHYDEFKYTRNLIAHGESDRFGLMILAWGPGQKSPIHDHNGSHCVMRVLEGELIETLYNNQSTKTENGDEMDSDSSFEPLEIYEKTRETLLNTGETAYIHDKIGWHRVINASQTRTAVSLHLYAPPIEKCRTFCEVEGRVRAQAACPYYSVNGQVVTAIRQKR